MGKILLHWYGSVPDDFRKERADCGRRGRKTHELPGKPIEELKALLRKYRSPKMEELPPFTGGAIGFLDMTCCNIMRSFQPMRWMI